MLHPAACMQTETCSDNEVRLILNLSIVAYAINKEKSKNKCVVKVLAAKKVSEYYDDIKSRERKIKQT
jgi:hypothetical protein